MNQLATPGLGSLMAGRWLAGAGQLVLAVAGFALVCLWFLSVLKGAYEQFDTGAQPKSAAWLGEAGAALFALSWVWALITSLSLLREARANQPQPPQLGAS